MNASATCTGAAPDASEANLAAAVTPPTSSALDVSTRDNKGWSLTCGETRWSRLVAGVFCGVASLTFERTTLIARGRPALPRCADSKSGDKMIDRVSIPVRLRSLGL